MENICWTPTGGIARGLAQPPANFCHGFAVISGAAKIQCAKLRSLPAEGNESFAATLSQNDDSFVLCFQVGSAKNYQLSLAT